MTSTAECAKTSWRSIHSQAPGGEHHAPVTPPAAPSWSRPSTPHTVCVKTPYRIGGQDYCRHHIIRAAVAAGVIAEVKPGAGPVATVSRGASSEERFRPFQG